MRAEVRAAGMVEAEKVAATEVVGSGAGSVVEGTEGATVLAVRAVETAVVEMGEATVAAAMPRCLHGGGGQEGTGRDVHTSCARGST